MKEQTRGIFYIKNVKSSSARHLVNILLSRLRGLELLPTTLNTVYCMHTWYSSLRIYELTFI